MKLYNIVRSWFSKCGEEKVEQVDRSIVEYRCPCGFTWIRLKEEQAESEPCPVCKTGGRPALVVQI